MKDSKLKYSIIVPSRNGGKYLPTCIETIISLNYDDYELIISDDHSDDNTMAYLQTLKQPNVKVIVPPEGLSMAEHWEWALSHACGEWLIFVGQDDGLQPYFFKLADKLTQIADKKNVRTIMSQRAYYFWDGCEEMYGNRAVDYTASAGVKLLNCKFQSMLVLLGFKAYFELPEMYTTSLFKREVIAEAKVKQNELLFVTHPQDANLAAIACSLEKKYLFSSIPLGWVGSSPKSAGLAMNTVFNKQNSGTNKNELKAVHQDYVTKTANSRLKMHPLAGDFSFASCSIYYWGALLQTQNLRDSWVNDFLNFKLFKIFMFGGVYTEVLKNRKFNVENRLIKFNEILALNKCNRILVTIVSIGFKFLYLSYDLGMKIVNKVTKVMRTSFSYNVNRTSDREITMISVSRLINEIIEKQRMIEKI
jgi:glycosyltransferase involved in cell wall biosynthesis